MKRSTEIVPAFAFLLFPPVVLSLWLGWDLTHPRQWDYPGQNPHVYGWGVALHWLLVIYICNFISRNERRLVRKARTDRLLAEARNLIREKRFAEAEARLAEAKILTGFTDSRSADTSPILPK